MKIDSLQLFVDVAELGSFSAVAKKLDLPRANISRRIADIEAALDVTLFIRSTRQLSLTPLGRAYYHDVKLALQAFNTACNNLKKVNLSPSGKIKIGLPPTAERSTVTLITRFLKNYPDLDIEVLYTHNCYKDFCEQGLDIALHMGTMPPSDLIARRVMSYSKRIVASHDFIHQFGKPSDIFQLSTMPSVCYRLPDGTLENKWDSNFGVVNVKPVITTNSVDMMLQVILEGQAFGLMPDMFSSPYVDKGKLAVLLPSLTMPESELYIVYPQKNSISLGASFLIEYLLAEIPKAVELS
ncbi:LysR family transcriptional regulator [Thaumasiovibrio subtropicus]|uniref:LysR family transcriptional regulator n=1 Tax=Thaumasiovibrio subtropicus TaxID=1891207 RepID=UPI000B350C33|nr:LysR family transcriptional regulator [Thaumasiovibrio subtropicus]